MEILDAPTAISTTLSSASNISRRKIKSAEMQPTIKHMTFFELVKGSIH